MGIAYGLRKLLLAALLLFAGIALTAAPLGGAAATLTEQALYGFCSQAGCVDGSFPNAAPIMDAAGKLYGTTSAGGNGNHSVVYKLAPNPNGSGWTETVLYPFCSQPNCADGTKPSGLVMDAAGNLYGTTNAGGARNWGTVFKLSPNQSGGWTETVIYSFCSNPDASCLTGAQPSGGLTMDSAGNLYGTAPLGGNGSGTVFELTPDQSGTTWTATPLHGFCPNWNCADGSQPLGGVIMDSAGNLYGTTSQGGANSNNYWCSVGCGTAFVLTPNQDRSVWTETVLYDFCSQPNCADGSTPSGGLIVDMEGSLYGPANHTVFRLSRAKSGWTSQVVYRGAEPSGVIFDEAGNLYGTDGYGGANRYCGGSIATDCGSVFMLTPNQGRTVWTAAVLYGFCPQGQPCTDGSEPAALLLRDPAGNLFGTTVLGGNYSICGQGCGTVFVLSTGNFAVTVSETGNGKVTSSPAGIDCPTTCTGIFPAETQVSLTAISASGGSTFAGWGGASSGAKTCTLTMNSSQRIAATFTQNLIHAVAVSLVGSSGGAVTSTPAGIECGATCSASFNAGTVVTLIASPAKGWGLAGWGGACSGIGRCTLTLNASTSVSASFSTLFGNTAAPVVSSPTDGPPLPPALIGPLPND